jgi:hypothetical protein
MSFQGKEVRQLVSTVQDFSENLNAVVSPSLLTPKLTEIRDVRLTQLSMGKCDSISLHNLEAIETLYLIVLVTMYVTKQGCQIFLVPTIYQNGKNKLNNYKNTKYLQKLLNNFKNTK